VEPADPYDVLAPVYDEWHESLGLEWVTRLETHLARYGSMRDGLSLLDLGCGTGTLLVEMRARHPSWRLMGVDASAAMLAEAKRKPRADTIDWMHAAFEDVRGSGGFDVVGCFFDALNHLLPDGALAKALAAASAALVPGGLLIFDLNNQRGCEEGSLTRSSVSFRTWGASSHTVFDPRTRVETTRFKVRLQAGAPVETVLRRRCFTPEEVAAALDTAGFVIELEEAWSLAHAQTLGKTWYVARKRRVHDVHPHGRK
jgi:predicted TPR repeat methyltransferase